MPEIHLLNLHLHDFQKPLTEVLDELLKSNVRLSKYYPSPEKTSYKLLVSDKNAIRIVQAFFTAKYGLEISLFYISKWTHELN